MQKVFLTTMILFLILAFTGCRKDSLSELIIDLSSEVVTEKTTHTFTFKVKSEQPLPAGDKLYCRYNWDGIGEWDTPLTQDLEVHHRYYSPGVYRMTCECLTQSGYTATDSLEIVVEQGHSNPLASFSIAPPAGHFMTEFLFDASSTTDDEDSLSALQFRWDVMDDGVYETPFQSDPSFTYTFKKMGLFPVRLDVRDPSGRFGGAVRWVEIKNIDEHIIPVLEMTPEVGCVMDTLRFDASNSHHLSDNERKLSFSWQFGYGVPSTPSSDSAVVYRVFDKPGPVRVVLTITDPFGLQNSLARDILITMGNLPPTSYFEVPSRYGNIQTQFYFRTWGSTDDHQGGTDLDKRWDFDGDGIWDTQYHKDMEMYHQYTDPGIYHPTLEVRDAGGLTDTYSLEIEISPYENPTGYVLDQRDNKMYATVKIGSYWWMSENLDWRPDTTKAEMRMIHRCYDEKRENCDKYGGLYLGPYVKYYKESGRNVCPAGWHVPDKAEMEDLSAHLPPTNSREALRPGGSLDFNLMYSGSGSYFFKLLLDKVVDTVWSYKDIGITGYATSQAFRGADQVLTVQATVNSPEGWVFWYPASHQYYPIRCVRD